MKSVVLNNSVSGPDSRRFWSDNRVGRRRTSLNSCWTTAVVPDSGLAALIPTYGPPSIDVRIGEDRDE